MYFRHRHYSANDDSDRIIDLYIDDNIFVKLDAYLQQHGMNAFQALVKPIPHYKPDDFLSKSDCEFVRSLSLEELYPMSKVILKIYKLGRLISNHTACCRHSAGIHRLEVYW